MRELDRKGLAYYPGFPVPRKSDGNNQRDRVDLYDARNQSWVWRRTRGRITGRRSGRTRHFNSNHHVISPWISHAEQSTQTRRRHLGFVPSWSGNGDRGSVALLLLSEPHCQNPKSNIHLRPTARAPHNPDTPRQSCPAETPPHRYPRTHTNTPADTTCPPRSPSPPPKRALKFVRNP
jgi:hypothetical protein